MKQSPAVDDCDRQISTTIGDIANSQATSGQLHVVVRRARGYRPLNFGLRRSRNAATPSLWSSVMLASANWSTSMWLARSSSADVSRLTVNLVMATDSGG